MKKGISPLISAVMLIAFTMMIGSITAPYISGLFQDSATDTSKEQDKILDTTGAQLSIKNANYDAGSGNYTLDVINSGQIEIENITLTLYGGNITQKRITKTLIPGEIISTEINTGSRMNRIQIDAENRELTVEEPLS